MMPFAQTLEWMTGDKFPKSVSDYCILARVMCDMLDLRDLLGGSPVAWVDLHMQQHRLNDNIQVCDSGFQCMGWRPQANLTNDLNCNSLTCSLQGSQMLAKSLVEGYRDIQV